MKRGIGPVLAMAVIWLMASPAGAHDTSFNTTIEIEDVVGVTVNDYRYYGEVRSQRGRCVRGRTVKIFSITEDGRKLIDTDRTSRNGFWFGGGDFTPAGTTSTTAVVARVLRRDTGPRRHDHVCRADRNREGIA
jgi:hypothetical protein